MRVAVVGLPYFGRKAAASLRAAGLDARFVPNPRVARPAPAELLHLWRSEVVYAIGVSAARWSPADLLARLGKRLVLHWVGSDVLHARRAHARGALSPRLVRSARHLADAPWLAEELRELGIRAEVRSLPVEMTLGAPLPLPERFAVLLYLPTQPSAGYDVSAAFDVVQACPDVPFLLVGGYRPPEPMPNVRALGYVDDMPSVYERTAVYLRLMRHDGLAHSVIEALSFGRYVLWSYPHPGVRQVRGVEEAVSAIRELRGAREPNLAGAEAARAYRAEATVPPVVAILREVASR